MARTPRTSRTTPLGLAGRAFRAFRGGIAVLGIVVLIGSAAIIAWPRVTAGLLQSQVQFRVGQTTASVRDLTATVSGESYASYYANGSYTIVTPPAWTATPGALTKAYSSMAPELRAVSGPGRYVGRSDGQRQKSTDPLGLPVAHASSDPKNSVLFLSFEADPKLADDAVLTAGHWPHAVDSTLGPSDALPVVLSQAAANKLHWKVGTGRTVPLGDGQIVRVVLSGTVAPRNPSADFWQLDSVRAGLGVNISSDPNSRITQFHGIGWVDAGSWSTLSPQIGNSFVSTWFPINGDAMRLDTLSGVEAGIKKFVASPVNVDPGPPVLQARFTTGVTSVIDDVRSETGSLNTLLAIIATGPLGAAIAVLFLGARILAMRRASSLELLRARGATERRLRGTVALEAAVFTVPAALIGGFGALLAIPGEFRATTVWLMLACAIVPPAVVALSASPRQANRRGEPAPPRWIWVIELLVVALAVVSIVLLLQRGTKTVGDPLALDPLLVLTPLLIVLAVCVIVLRLYPVLLGWIGPLLHRARGAVSYLGWATATRGRGGRLWPLLAVLAGVSVTIFAGSVLTTTVAGVRTGAVQNVGADISVSAPRLTDGQIDRIRAVDGVDEVAPVTLAGIGRLSDDENVPVYFADAAQLRSVQRAVPRDQRLFGDEASPPPRGSKTATALAGGLDRSSPTSVRFDNDTLTLPLNTTMLSHAAGSFISAGAWVLVDQASVPTGKLPDVNATAALIRLTPGANADRVEREVTTIGGQQASVTVAGARAAEFTAGGLLPGFETLAVVGGLLAAVMCVAALVLTLSMNAAARTRMLATLRMLGFARRQSTALLAWELGPIALTAIVIGTLVGYLLPTIVLRAVDLRAVTGGALRPELVISGWLVAASVALFVLGTALATVIAMALSRRTPPASVLREGGTD